MAFSRIGGMFAALLTFAASAVAQEIPALVEISSQVAAAHPELVGQRAALVQERQALHARFNQHNLNCTNIDPENKPKIAQCTSEQAALLAELKAHIGRSEGFNAAARSASPTAQGDQGPPSSTQPVLVTFPEAAAELVTILDQASRNLNLPKGPPTNRDLVSLKCQAFFREVAKQLRRNQKESWEEDFAGLDADGIVTRIDDVASDADKWKKIAGKNPAETWAKAQELANKGVIVVGGSKAHASGHGHLGIVFPIPSDIDPSKFGGRGPFVRDGNEHEPKGRVFPSTWGAVRASEAFVLSRTNWYIWVVSSR